MVYQKVHVHHLTVEFDWLDAGGVVYHPNYLIICDRARSAALSQAGYSVGELWKDGFALALVETHTRYLKPALLGQALSVLTATSQVTPVRITVSQKLVQLSEGARTTLNEGFHSSIPTEAIQTLFYTAEITAANIDLKRFRSTPFPPRLIEALQLKI